MSSGPNIGTPTTLFCTNCGAATSPSDSFCPKCGTPLPRTSVFAPPPPVQPGYVAAPVSPYAGFWRRFLAIILDQILVRIAVAPFGFFFVGPEALRPVWGDAPRMGALLVGSFAVGALFIIVNWLYEALMTSSTKQATIGKMALGIKVTDTQGQPISFGRASARHFSKYISSFILFIGFIMAAFTERKQALHDLIAETLVVKA